MVYSKCLPHNLGLDDMDAHIGQSMPFVSFIIVARNAEKYLINLLADYLRQDYPIEFRELIMVDGGSEDDTKKVAQDFALQHPELAITILDNPKQTLAPGWNLAIKQARGDIVCRPDAHASIPPDYLRTGVHLLMEHQTDGVVCVGGPLHTMGNWFLGPSHCRGSFIAFWRRQLEIPIFKVP